MEKRAATIIRPLMESDAAEVAAIAAQSPGAAQWPESSYRSLTAHGIWGWVAEGGGRIRGFLVGRITGDQAELLNLAVLTAQRRRGVGAELLQTFVQTLAERGIREIFLEVRESNAAAVAFYRAQGFQETGRRTGYYREPREDAICMSRKLTG